MISASSSALKSFSARLEIPITIRPSIGIALPIAQASRVRVLMPGDRRRSCGAACSARAAAGRSWRSAIR